MSVWLDGQPTVTPVRPRRSVVAATGSAKSPAISNAAIEANSFASRIRFSIRRTPKLVLCLFLHSNFAIPIYPMASPRSLAGGRWDAKSAFQARSSPSSRHDVGGVMGVTVGAESSQSL